jgi:hypothetical protein
MRNKLALMFCLLLTGCEAKEFANDTFCASILLVVAVIVLWRLLKHG